MGLDTEDALDGTDEEYGDGDDDEDIEDEDEEEEEDLPLEVRLERALEEKEELQAVVKSLVDQITCYREIVSKDKENDQQRLEAVRAELQEQKQMVAQLERDASAGNALVQRRMQEMEAQLAAAQAMNEKLRENARRNLEAWKQEMVKLDENNKVLNERLDDERSAHKQTIMKLMALEKETKRPAPQIHDQEVRLRVSFDGSAITAAVLIPENDEERAKLKQENDFYREKCLTLNQTQCMLRDELGSAQEQLQKALSESKVLSAELNGLKDRHTQALKEIDHLKNDSSPSSSAVSPPNTPGGKRRTAAGKHKDAAPEQQQETLLGGAGGFSGIYKEALRIYETYLLAGSKTELPLAQETKYNLFRCFASEEGIRPTMFTGARNEALQLMDTKYFAEWRAEQSDDCSYKSFQDVVNEIGNKPAKKSVTTFFTKKGKPEFTSFLEETTTFSQMIVGRSASLSDLKSAKTAHSPALSVSPEDDSVRRSETPDTTSSGSSSSEKRHHKKKKHTHRSSQLSKSVDVSPASPATTQMPQPGAGGAPPLPPPPQTDPAYAATLVSPTVVASPASGTRRMTVPSGAEDLVEMFNKPDQQPQPQTPGSMSASTGVQRPGPATQMLGNNGRKTIRKTMRMRRLTVDGTDTSSLGISSLYGGPVTPEALLPNSETAALLFSTPASPATVRPAPAPLKPPRLAKTVSASTNRTTASTVAPVGGARSSFTSSVPATTAEPLHARPMPRSGGESSGFSRSVTTYVQNLEELCGAACGHQDNSLMTTSSVKSILSVNRSMWVAHGSPSTISIYDRDTLAQKPEVPLRDVTVNNMVMAGKQVWLATSGKDLICINPVDPLFQRELRGHASGGIVDLAFMGGKNLWTVGMDQQIGVWNVETMKLRKMIKGSVMNCIVNVAGVAWIGTVRGIQRYDTTTLKQIRDSPLDPTNDGAAKYLKMPVTKLLVVNNYVWAVHHDESMISVWDSVNKAFITAFQAKNVVALLRVGANVWTTSHNNLITCYDIKEFAKVGELSGIHQDWVTCLTLARYRDGLRVWSGSTDSTIVLWDPMCRPHEFLSVHGRSGICDVCHKTFKPADDVLACKNCRHYCLHTRCRELLQLGCTCTAKPAPAAPAAALTPDVVQSTSKLI